MRKTFDAILDIIVLAILIYTILATIDVILWRFILTLLGCGAMFNNIKYIYTQNKKSKKNK